MNRCNCDAGYSGWTLCSALKTEILVEVLTYILLLSQPGRYGNGEKIDVELWKSLTHLLSKSISAWHLSKCDLGTAST